MIEVNIDFITGVSVGLEFPGAIQEDMAWSVVLDLLILRVIFIKWNRE